MPLLRDAWLKGVKGYLGGKVFPLEFCFIAPCFERFLIREVVISGLTSLLNVVDVFNHPTFFLFQISSVRNAPSQYRSHLIAVRLNMRSSEMQQEIVS